MPSALVTFSLLMETFPYGPCDSGQPLFVVSVVEEGGQGFKSSMQPHQVAFPRLPHYTESQVRPSSWSGFMKLSVTDKEAANLNLPETYFLKSVISEGAFK